jgi:hypothetical protein
MTKRPPVMGISIYRGERLLGKALNATIDGTTVTLGPATIHRFEVLRYLLPRATADLMGEKGISNMPPLTIYCDPTTVKGKKKKGGWGEGIVRITFQPQTIEIDPSMPGQNFSLKSFKGVLVGSIDTGVVLPQEAVATVSPSDESATSYY